MTFDDVPRPYGSYDPNEPFVITYGDLIAARNATAALVNILRDQDDPPSDYQQKMIKLSVRVAVPRDDEPYSFDTLDQAILWLADLRDRLNALLPTSLPET